MKIIPILLILLAVAILVFDSRMRYIAYFCFTIAALLWLDLKENV